MENGTRHGVIGGIMSAAALVMSCVAIAICLGIRVDVRSTALDASKEEIIAGDAVPVAKTEEKTAKYKAQIENGYVVVRDAGGTVVKTLKTPVKFMTDGDREYFAAGVDIFTEDELAEICDDFGN